MASVEQDAIVRGSSNRQKPMGSLSPVHWIIVVVIILLLFGPQRLAGVGKGLGEGIRSFKKGISEDSPDDSKEGDKQLSEKKPNQGEDGRIA